MAVAEGDKAGGYDEDFINKPDDTLYCPICLMVARDARQHGKCGQLFCNSCLVQHKKQKDNCPYCKEDNASFFEDNRSNRQIRSLVVRCVNKQDGCQWEGELRSSASHVSDKCDYRLVKCPLECGMEITWMFLDHHQREECKNRCVLCSECHKNGQYWYITTDHMKICPMVMTRCPNSGCDMAVRRNFLKIHVDTDCEYTPVECKYKSGGCQEKLRRKDMEAHENNDKLHLQILCRTVATQQDKIEALEMRIVNLQRHSTKFKIKNFSPAEYFKKYIEFEANLGTYKMTADIRNIPTNEPSGVYISFCILKGKNDDELVWPFSGTVKVELLNQQKDKDHYTKTIYVNRLKRTDQEKIHSAILQIVFLRNQYFIISTKDLENSEHKYYPNKTLYFQMTVRTDSYKPWLHSP